MTFIIFILVLGAVVLVHEFGHFINAKIFREIKLEYNGFINYLNSFTDGNIVYEYDKTRSELSDRISNDLKKRGMKFVGSTIIYSYLQAIGIINSHEKTCYLYGR